MKSILVALLLSASAAFGDFSTESAPYQPFAVMSGFKLLVAKPANPMVKAGAKQNDVITSVNGKLIESTDDIKWAFAQPSIKELSVLRGDKPMVVKAKAGK